jgi:Domain of unknown function (DUF1963)
VEKRLKLRDYWMLPRYDYMLTQQELIDFGLTDSNYPLSDIIDGVQQEMGIEVYDSTHFYQFGHLFGYSSCCQGSPEWRVSRFEYQETTNQQIMDEQATSSRKWLNLFYFSADKTGELNAFLGDGTISYMIHEDDLKAKRFDNVRLEAAWS